MRHLKLQIGAKYVEKCKVSQEQQQQQQQEQQEQQQQQLTNS